MSEYQEIKQIVDYPRCRIYRQFIQMLLAEKNIRIGGTSGLFYYSSNATYRQTLLFVMAPIHNSTVAISSEEAHRMIHPKKALG